MPKYIVAITVHVTVDAISAQEAEQKAFENSKEYLDHPKGGRTITAWRVIREVR